MINLFSSSSTHIEYISVLGTPSQSLLTGELFRIDSFVYIGV